METKVKAEVYVTHLGLDYSTIQIEIPTKYGKEVLSDIETELCVGEELVKAGQTKWDYKDL